MCTAPYVYFSLFDHADFIAPALGAIQAAKISSTEALLDHLTATSTTNFITACAHSDELPPSYCDIPYRGIARLGMCA